MVISELLSRVVRGELAAPVKDQDSRKHAQADIQLVGFAKRDIAELRRIAAAFALKGGLLFGSMGITFQVMKEAALVTGGHLGLQKVRTGESITEIRHNPLARAKILRARDSVMDS